MLYPEFLKEVDIEIREKKMLLTISAIISKKIL